MSSLDVSDNSKKDNLKSNKIKNESEKSNKQQLGQFFTTNYKYILQNMHIPKKTKKIIEPFAGNGDLLHFVTDKSIPIQYYDIDPKKDYITKRDTLKDPPDYKNKFILTNPPYLARNKNKDKSIYDTYQENDLYKCFLKSILTSQCAGGIIIIPLNFWCSIRKKDIQLRKSFLQVFSVLAINIFEEQVFQDTSYTTCCFQFKRKIVNKIQRETKGKEDKKKEEDSNSSSNNISKIKCYIYPSKKKLDILLNDKNNYTIGGEIYQLPTNKNIKIERATASNKKQKEVTNILVKCLDDSIDNQIALSIVSKKDRYIDTSSTKSARSYATLVITPKITREREKTLVQEFNTFLKKERDKYHSLFLTNYRESNSIARKRISFKLVFQIVNYLLSK